MEGEGGVLGGLFRPIGHVLQVPKQGHGRSRGAGGHTAKGRVAFERRFVRP